MCTGWAGTNLKFLKSCQKDYCQSDGTFHHKSHKSEAITVLFHLFKVLTVDNDNWSITTPQTVSYRSLYDLLIFNSAIIITLTGIEVIRLRNNKYGFAKVEHRLLQLWKPRNLFYRVPNDVMVLSFQFFMVF